MSTSPLTDKAIVLKLDPHYFFLTVYSVVLTNFTAVPEPACALLLAALLPLARRRRA